MEMLMIPAPKLRSDVQHRLSDGAPQSVLQAARGRPRQPPKCQSLQQVLFFFVMMQAELRSFSLGGFCLSLAVITCVYPKLISLMEVK